MHSKGVLLALCNYAAAVDTSAAGEEKQGMRGPGLACTLPHIFKLGLLGVKAEKLRALCRNAGDVFEQGWKQARELGAAYVDEHYYQAPWWFIANMHRYDAYPAEGTRAFLGEYASKDEKWWNALVEAAYMLGMEKAPGVGLACYATLFCNADYVNWKPDMIWFNNHQAYGTASYHVQKLMMLHQGDHEVALTQEGGRTLMAEPSTVQGEIGFASDLADIIVADVCLTNLDTGEEIRADAIHLCGETPSYLLANVEWTNYRVTFRAMRNMDCDEKHFVGGRPFALEFGRKDADNMLRWIIDGWTNLTSIVQIREGELADLTAHYYERGYYRNEKYTL